MKLEVKHKSVVFESEDSRSSKKMTDYSNAIFADESRCPLEFCIMVKVPRGNRL